MLEENTIPIKNEKNFGGVQHGILTEKRKKDQEHGRIQQREIFRANEY